MPRERSPSRMLSSSPAPALMVAAESDTRWLPMCVKAPSMLAGLPPLQSVFCESMGVPVLCGCPGQSSTPFLGVWVRARRVCAEEVGVDVVAAKDCLC